MQLSYRPQDVIREFNEHITEDNLFIDNINCQLDSGSRAQILNKFKNTEYSVISNAKCLTEGVDVPIIDSVYFIDRKNLWLILFKHAVEH